MNLNKFGGFLIAISILILAFCGFEYYMAGYGTRWEEARAIGEMMRGDTRSLEKYRSEATETRLNGKIAGIIGGLMLILGSGLIFSFEPISNELSGERLRGT